MLSVPNMRRRDGAVNRIFKLHATHGTRTIETAISLAVTDTAATNVAVDIGLGRLQPT